MILYRVFPRRRRRGGSEMDGPLWFPRAFQGRGRHDNPDDYGCLYLTERETAGVVELLAEFRGQTLAPQMLTREGLRLALASIELRDDATLVDLDRPSVLSRERLPPSLVATRERSVTQPQALVLWQRHPDAVGLRWWSTYESAWPNVTLFDRASPALRLVDVRELTPADSAVVQAADFLGLTP